MDHEAEITFKNTLMAYEAEIIFKSALMAYAAIRAEKMLDENPFTVLEMTSIISAALHRTIETGIANNVQERLATKHLTHNRDGRLVKAS
jgi:hypothetical protein